MASTFETVADIISSTSDVPLERIKPESHIMKDLEVDSLAFLDIAFEIDQRFSIKLPIEDWMQNVNEGKVKSDDYFVVGNLCGNIDKLVAVAAAA
jgi:acyl carrier protein